MIKTGSNLKDNGRRREGAFLSQKEVEALWQSVQSDGWERGLTAFLNTLTAGRARTILSLAYEENGGWKYLLDLTRNKRALIFETGLGGTTLALAKDFQEVYCALPDSKRLDLIRSRIVESEAAQIRSIFMDGLQRWPYDTGYFDAVILHPIEAWFQALIHSERREVFDPRKTLQSMIQEAHRVLNASGFLFLTFGNRWSGAGLLDKIRGAKKDGDFGTRSSFTIRRGKKAFTQVGFKETRVYPIFPAVSRIEEISDGAPVREPFYQINFKESIKRWVSRHPRFKKFSPGFIFVGAKAPYIRSVDRMIGRVNQGKNDLSLRKYRLMRSNKVILELSSQKGPGLGKIVKIPLDPLARARCERNSENLLKLGSAQNALSNRIPFSVRVETFDRETLYIENALSGIAVDLPIPALDGVIRQAAGLLRQFQQESFETRRLEGALFDELVRTPMEILKRSFSFEGFSERMEAIEAAVREGLYGEETPLVWRHGDYKLENLLVHPRSFEIRGVIDWDLSSERGLPLLDLFHLLVHRDRVQKGRPTHEAILEKVLCFNLDPFETERVSEYLEALRIPPSQVPALAILYWVDHIVYRITPQPKRLEWWVHENIVKAIECLKDFPARPSMASFRDGRVLDTPDVTL